MKLAHLNEKACPDAKRGENLGRFETKVKTATFAGEQVTCHPLLFFLDPLKTTRSCM
jgi:hypothetical protein